MNIKLRFKGTYLGLLWTGLEPLFMFLILYVVFTGIRETREDFAIYLIIGVLAYHLFIRGTSGGLASVKENSSILKSLNIQKDFFPVVATGTTSLFLLVHVGVFILVAITLGYEFPSSIILLPIMLSLLLLLILGLSYFLSITFVYVKDIQPFWNIFTYALLFVSPIFWYLDDVKEGILIEIQKINPLGQLIEIAHKLVLGNYPTLNDWLYTASIIFVIVFVGFALFKKYEKTISEKI